MIFQFLHAFLLTDTSVVQLCCCDEFIGLVFIWIKSHFSSLCRLCPQQIWTWSCMCVRPLILSRCLGSTPAPSVSLCCCPLYSSSPLTWQPALSSKSGEQAVFLKCHSWHGFGCLFHRLVTMGTVSYQIWSSWIAMLKIFLASIYCRAHSDDNDNNMVREF